MKELLEKIFDQRSNGLYFVNTPTGSAKSYSAVQLMKNNYKTFDKHFIFITNNLNNLPMEDLKDALGEDEYKANVLRVESIVDNIVHHFYETRIPDEFQALEAVGQEILLPYVSFLDYFKDNKNYSSFIELTNNCFGEEANEILRYFKIQEVSEV